jgi:hypothetical protein
MEHTERKDCLYEGLIYPHASEIRLEAENLVCKNGDWLHFEAAPADAELSLAYFYH